MLIVIPSSPTCIKPIVSRSLFVHRQKRTGIKNKSKMKNKKSNCLYKITVVEWVDSYGAMSGWVNLEDYEPQELVCVSSGVKVYENKKVVALAPNYATSTTYTPQQANGLMVIPKSCICRITTFSCFEPVSKQKLQHS